jgi:glucose/arabinose dehydrogenase
VIILTILYIHELLPPTLPKNNKALLFSLAVLLILTGGNTANSQEGQSEQKIPDVNVAIGNETADIRDPVAEGLEFPTTMAFLGPNDILVLEKEKGTVQRIINHRKDACVELQYLKVFQVIHMYFSTLPKWILQTEKMLLKELIL